MLYSGFKIAFSMYSKIPMPKTEWSKVNMRYAMCFFPLIGIVIGGMFYLFHLLSIKLSLTTSFFAAVMTLIPLMITGGIHFDGFLDTVDARHSYQPVEKKLEILKDPHTGAFAIIGGVSYLLLNFGVCSELYTTKYLLFIAVSFVASRAFSGLSVVTFPTAKNSGLLKTFSDQAQKKNVQYTMYVYLIACFILLLVNNLILGSLCILTSIMVFFYYYRMSKKEFGGITGDLAGYFLQIYELIFFIVVVLYEKVVYLWS